MTETLLGFCWCQSPHTCASLTTSAEVQPLETGDLSLGLICLLCSDNDSQGSELPVETFLNIFSNTALIWSNLVRD